MPFFTTKPGGSGIGLVLSRQIAEAHGGSLLLENRDDRRGCRASLRLPLQQAQLWPQLAGRGLSSGRGCPAAGCQIAIRVVAWLGSSAATLATK